TWRSSAGVPGLEPRLNEPESLVLPITPYPTAEELRRTPWQREITLHRRRTQCKTRRASVRVTSITRTEAHSQRSPDGRAHARPTAVLTPRRGAPAAPAGGPATSPCPGSPSTRRAAATPAGRTPRRAGGRTRSAA